MAKALGFSGAETEEARDQSDIHGSLTYAMGMSLSDRQSCVFKVERRTM